MGLSEISGKICWWNYIIWSTKKQSTIFYCHSKYSSTHILVQSLTQFLNIAYCLLTHVYMNLCIIIYVSQLCQFQWSNHKCTNHLRAIVMCLILHVERDVPDINSSPTRQNGRLFAGDIFRCIFVNKKFCISVKISLNFVPDGSIVNDLALVQIMAWRRKGDKPLSEPMLTWFTDAYIRH